MAFTTPNRRVTASSSLRVTHGEKSWKVRSRGARTKRPISVITTLLVLGLLLVPMTSVAANALDPVQFVEQLSIPVARDSFVAWGDYDADGDLDVAAGCSFHDRNVHIFKNEPTGVLTEVQALPCGADIHGNSNPWADFDGDNDLDLALPARDESHIYINNEGVFSEDTRPAQISLPTQSSAGALFQWGDLDRDNDPDLVLIGLNVSGLFVNDGTGLLTSSPHPFLRQDNQGADLGDYDNDGYLDLVTTGSNAYGGSSRFGLIIYHNDGNGIGATPTFTQVGGELADRAGNVHWVDYDQDGLLDIFAAGGHDSTFYVEFWRQSPLRTFTQTVPPAFADYVAHKPPGSNAGYSDWGDYDGDGDPDLIISNNTINSGCLTRTFRNEPTGTLVEDDTTLLHNVERCYYYPQWGNFDNDPELELLAVDFYAPDPDPPPTFLRVFERNFAPTLTVSVDPVEVGEGGPASNTGTVTDANDDTVALSASIGFVANNSDGTWSWWFDTSDGPTESQTVTITGDDDNGGIATATFRLTVNNIAPTVDAVTVPSAPVNINEPPINANGTFIDPAGTADEAYTCTVDYGDEFGPLAGNVAGTTCDGPSHTFTEPGVYNVTVAVTDKDDATGSADADSFIVVYDPDGGFVTGGGWIDSPAGAYVPDPELSGKANFGFVSKYNKGANVPGGNTEFRFQAGDLNFHSDSYDWLVIAGQDKAKYKGVGTINGSGNYGFMLTAVDNGNSGDAFRIKIWDKDASDAVVYDNKAGDDASYSGTVIGGGNIKVHRK